MLVVISARMSSRRFPSKALSDVAGRTMLGRVVDRTQRSRLVDDVLVATSVELSDDPIVEFCRSEGVACFRGALDDVAGRVLGAVQEVGAPAFVRISGDSPLIDPDLIDQGVEVFSESRPDVATNVFPRTFPHGQSVEVIATVAFEALCRSQTDAHHREHVTSGFYAAPSDWRIVNFVSGDAGPLTSLSVDTADDLDRIVGILQTVGEGPTGWRQLCAAERPR